MAPVINLLWLDEYSGRCAQYKAISSCDYDTLNAGGDLECFDPTAYQMTAKCCSPLYWWVSVRAWECLCGGTLI